MSLDCKKPKVCIPTPEPPPHPPTPPFEVCIAMDYKLTWDGTHATLERVTTTTDGSYTMFNVVNGCIVNPGVGDIPTYTPPYCNPNPGDCQQGGGAGGTVNISHQAGNIITNNGDGLYARCYVQAGPGIVVVGVGTVYDPYVISGGTSGGGIVNVVGRDGINATVDENKVAYVGMTPTGVTPGTFRGLTIGVDGRVYNYDPNLDGAGVRAGRGLESHNEQDTLVIEHPSQQVSGSIDVGGWRLSHNDSGHLQQAQQLAAPVADGCYMVGGTEICFTNGIATSVGAGNGGGGGGGGNNGVPAPGALRDMIRVDLASTGATGTRIEYFGQRLQLTFDNPGQLRVQIPSYVTDISQVSANSTAGNCTASIDPGSGNLVVRYGGQASVDAQVITIAFRG